MIQDTYILQKDLPDSKAGDRYVYIDRAHAYYRNGDINDSYWLKANVENQPEWFKKEEELLYKVGDDLVALLRDCVSLTWGNSSLTQTQQLFDSFLIQRKLVKPNLNKTITRLVNEILLDKKYTEQDMRNCFISARKQNANLSDYILFDATYLSFEDYLNTIQNKNS